MADKNIKDKDLSYEELFGQSDKMKKEYIVLRFKKVLSHVDNPLQKRTMRREIARLNTFIRQKCPAAQKTAEANK